MTGTTDFTRTSLNVIRHAVIDSACTPPEQSEDPFAAADQATRPGHPTIRVHGARHLIVVKQQRAAGHDRLRATFLRELGMNSVPTIELAHLSPAQARAYLVADNKLGLNSDWDITLLAEHFQELSALDFDFELDICWFFR